MANLVQKIWYDRKTLAKKPPIPGLEWGPLFCWEIILAILSITKSPGILPLLSLPTRRLYRDCQTQEPLWARARPRIYRDASDVLHRFAGRIIKRGNGVGRTEWRSRRRMLGPSKCMQLSIMPSCCCAVLPPTPVSKMCWTASPSGLSFKVCGKSLPTCN